MSNVASDIELHAGLRMVPRSVGAGDLANGLLTLSMTSESVTEKASPLLMPDAGLVISGIKIVSGDPAVDLTAVLDGQIISLYCPVGTATLVHEDVNIDAEHRIDVFPTGQSLTIYRSLTQFCYSASAQRWAATDWGAYTGSSNSFASPPIWTSVAIERMAAQIAIFLGAPIPD